MPDENRTQGLSNDTPHDPLDDLIAPILGRDVTRETRRTTTHIATSNLGQPDPLDDLLSDDELLAESHKVTVVSDSRSKRHILRTAPVSVLLLVALLLVVTGVWGGGRFANRSEEAAPLADGVALRQVQGTTFEQTPQDANGSHERERRDPTCRERCEALELRIEHESSPIPKLQLLQEQVGVDATWAELWDSESYFNEALETAVRWCAAHTGFGSRLIFDLAVAGFDASALKPELQAEAQKLSPALLGLSHLRAPGSLSAIWLPR